MPLRRPSAEAPSQLTLNGGGQCSQCWRAPVRMADEEEGLLDKHSAAAEATAPAATEPAVRAAPPPATRAAATPYDAIRLYLKTRGFNQAWLTKVRRSFFFVTVGGNAVTVPSVHTPLQP